MRLQYKSSQHHNAFLQKTYDYFLNLYLPLVFGAAHKIQCKVLRDRDVYMCIKIKYMQQHSLKVQIENQYILEVMVVHTCNA